MTVDGCRNNDFMSKSVVPIEHMSSARCSEFEYYYLQWHQSRHFFHLALGEAWLPSANLIMTKNIKMRGEISYEQLKYRGTGTWKFLDPSFGKFLH